MRRFVGLSRMPSKGRVIAAGTRRRAGKRLSTASKMRINAAGSDFEADKLEELGIPVMVERSTYEDHPLGRTEWIKLFGEIIGLPEKAKAAW